MDMRPQRESVAETAPPDLHASDPRTRHAMPARPEAYRQFTHFQGIDAGDRQLTRLAPTSGQRLPEDKKILPGQCLPKLATPMYIAQWADMI